MAGGKVDLLAKIEALERTQIQALRQLRAISRSVTDRAEAGAEVLRDASVQPDLLDELAPLDEALLQQLVAEAQAAFSDALELPQEQLTAAHVRRLYMGLLRAVLGSEAELSVHDMHASALRGLHTCQPDIAVTDCWAPLPPHMVLFLELAPGALAAAQPELALRVEEHAGLLLAEQPDREAVWGVAGGADGLRVWRVERHSGMFATPALPLSCDAGSPGLQALARLLCTPACDLGYAPPQLPAALQLPDGRKLVGLAAVTRRGGSEDGAGGATCVLVGELAPDQALAVAKTYPDAARLQHEVGAGRFRSCAGPHARELPCPACSPVRSMPPQMVSREPPGRESLPCSDRN
jgi:hypothetical protein